MQARVFVVRPAFVAAVVSAAGLLGLYGLLGCVGGSAGVAQAADSSFSVKLEVPPAQKGQRAVVRVKVVPGAGYHMNKEFPSALVLTAPAGVTIERPRQAAGDARRFEEAGADFDVALTSAQAGKQVVVGDLKFAVCSSTSCDPKREKVSFTLEVK